MAAAPKPRDERTARVIDREIAPLWHDRFARMMWRHLAGESPALVLDVHAGSGRTAAELMHRLPSSAKVIALEPDPLLREIAKSHYNAYLRREATRSIAKIEKKTGNKGKGKSKAKGTPRPKPTTKPTPRAKPTPKPTKPRVPDDAGSEAEGP